MVINLSISYTYKDLKHQVDEQIKKNRKKDTYKKIQHHTNLGTKYTIDIQIYGTNRMGIQVHTYNLHGTPILGIQERTFKLCMYISR